MSFELKFVINKKAEFCKESYFNNDDDISDLFRLVNLECPSSHGIDESEKLSNHYTIKIIDTSDIINLKEKILENGLEKILMENNISNSKLKEQDVVSFLNYAFEYSIDTNNISYFSVFNKN